MTESTRDHHYIYKGRILYANGTKMDVKLKKGKLHWIDNNRNRWKFENGHSIHIEGAWPRLLVQSIKADEKVRFRKSKMTHTAKVKSPFGGKPRLIQFKETAAYWVDIDGKRYNKDTGWQSKDESQSYRMMLETIERIITNKGIPIKRQEAAK